MHKRRGGSYQTESGGKVEGDGYSTYVPDEGYNAAFKVTEGTHEVKEALATNQITRPVPKKNRTA